MIINININTDKLEIGMSDYASQLSASTSAASAAQRILQEQQESLKRSLDGFASLASARSGIASVAQRALQEHQERQKQLLDGFASLSSSRTVTTSVSQRALQEHRKSLKRSLDEFASQSSIRTRLASTAKGLLQEHHEVLERLRGNYASQLSARLAAASTAQRLLQGEQELRERLRGNYASRLFISTSAASVAQRALQEQRESLKRLLDGFASLSFARKEAASAVSRLFQERQENSFTTEFARHIHISSALQQTGVSMAAQVLEQIEKQDLVIDEIADVVLETIEEKSKKSPKDIISTEGLINFLFVIIFFLINMQYSKEAEDRIIKTIDKIHEPLINFMEKHGDMDTKSTYYFANRSVNLRALPNTESSIIAILHPNQRVELVKQKDRWLYIMYFDHIHGVPRIGWVYHRYLSLVQ